MIKSKLLPILLSILLISIPSFLNAVELAEIGKVTGVYQRSNSTILTVEIETKLPTGTEIFIEKEIKAILADLYMEVNGKYTYEATLAGKGTIEKNAKVYVPGQKEQQGVDLYLKIERYAKFEPKKRGKVLASYGPKVSIDRGSLHEVGERDIYAVYDSSGKFVANVEAAGIGDYETIAYKWGSDKKKIDPGYNIVLVGKRRFFGLGIICGVSLPLKDKTSVSFFEKSTVLSKTEDIDALKSYGNFENSATLFAPAGLLWEWQLKDGWGVQWFWGDYAYITSEYHYKQRTIADSNGVFQGYSYIGSRTEYTVHLYSPFAVKKNFLYPNWFSPYIGLGAGYLLESFKSIKRITYNEPPEYKYQEVYGSQIEAEIGYLTIYPVAGINFFSSDTIHAMFDLKYIPPWRKLEANGEEHTWSGWITSIGVTTNW
ncbi:MAG: hypothetical protein ABII64_02575 [Elusimicrobiota bacterium]